MNVGHAKANRLAIGSRMNDAGVALLAQPELAEKLSEGGSWRAGETSGGIKRLVDVIDRHASGGSVFFLSSTMVPGFPVMSYTDVEWASRYSHLWFILAIVRTRSDPLYMPTRLTKERAAQIERNLFDSVVEDLERYEPELILVRRGKVERTDAPVSNLQFLLRDPAFRRIWTSHYRVTTEIVMNHGVVLRK